MNRKSQIDIIVGVSGGQKVGADLLKTSAKVAGFGKAMEMTLSAMAQFSAESVKAFAELEYTLAKVGAVGGKTTGEMEQISGVVKGLGASTVFTANEVAQGFESLTRAGFDTNESLGAIASSMQLAQISGVSVGRATQIVADNVRTFGNDAKNSSYYVDLLAKTSSSSNQTLDQLATSMQYASGVASAMGISSEELSIALGIMANAGERGSRAGMAIRTSLARLVNPSKEASEIMKSYGVNIDEVTIATDGLRGTLMKLADLSKAELLTIFGTQQGGRMIKLIQNMGSGWDEMGNKISNASGEATRMQNQIDDTTKGAMTRFSSAWDGIKTQTGEVISEAINLKGILDGMASVMNFISGVEENMEFASADHEALYHTQKKLTEARADETHWQQRLNDAVRLGHTRSEKYATAKLKNIRSEIANLEENETFLNGMITQEAKLGENKTKNDAIEKALFEKKKKRLEEEKEARRKVGEEALASLTAQQYWELKSEEKKEDEKIRILQEGINQMDAVFDEQTKRDVRRHEEEIERTKKEIALAKEKAETRAKYEGKYIDDLNRDVSQISNGYSQMASGMSGLLNITTMFGEEWAKVVGGINTAIRVIKLLQTVHKGYLLVKSGLEAKQKLAKMVSDRLEYKRTIALANANAVKSGMSAGFPQALVTTPLLQAMAMTSIAKVPMFAEGGVVHKATLGVFGEAGSEAVVPLEKWENSLMNAYDRGNGGMGGKVEFELRGDRLIGVIKNYEKFNKS